MWCACDFRRYLFTLYHFILLPISVLSGLRFISLSSAPPSLFNWPRVQLYLKVPHHIYVLKWHIIHYLNLRFYPLLREISFTHLRHFLIFLFFCFHWKITWHLGKVDKNVKNERVSNWFDAQSSCSEFTSFNVTPCLLPKTTDKLLL